jgi:phage gp16-like protein
MASFIRTKEATLLGEVESFQRQLAEFESYAAALQATIKETCDTLALTDLDYKRIVAIMQQQQQSRNQSKDCSFTTALLESTR